MTHSIARTIAAYERRNKLRTGKGRPRHYLTTPEGRTVTEDHFGPPLAAFIRGDLELKPLSHPPISARCCTRSTLRHWR